jgi:ABC-type multidrug transport system ATPase subunit
MLEQPIMTSRDHDQDPAPAIVTLGLTRRFGPLTAVRDLSLQVPRGSVYGFLGLNGAGKSTTIRMLLGLLRPTSGEVALLGSAMPGDRLSALGRIGALVESPTVYPHLTGVENLEATRRLLGVGRQGMARALDVVGLSDAGCRLVREYSTGMRQRLGLALALIGEPELLVLDEPTNGLDPRGIQEVRELVRELPGRLGVTVFLSSHILAEVEQVASHVGIIHKGRLVAQGELEELLGRGLLRVGVGDSTEARGRLVGLGWPVRPGGNGTLLVDVTQRDDAVAVNEILVHGGHRVSHLVYERASLEHVFFEATRDPQESSP